MTFLPGLAPGVLIIVIIIWTSKKGPIMTMLDRSHQSRPSISELDSRLGTGGLDLNDYLLASRRQLNEIAGLAANREAISRTSRDWMLTQVDFIIDTVGDETLELAEEMRSQLLQLLLAIANLNEQIRQQGSLGL